MKVLAISAHPDDETLGCGGTLLRHRACGDEISWVVTTQTHEPQWSQESVTQRSAEVDVVATQYGMSKVFRLGFPTIRLETVPQADLIDRLREAIVEVRPEVVYLVHDGDVHSDHHAVFTATMAVLKTFYMRSLGVRRVLCFETLSSTEAAPVQLHRTFLPQIYHDISPYLEEKLLVMAQFASETQEDPWPRGPSAIKALARFRGASIGVDYAEAFMLIREVD